MTRRLRCHAETWPIAGTFTISRGSRHEVEVVVAEISEGGHTGRGECVPYARYQESRDGVLGAIAGLKHEIAAGAGRDDLRLLLPAGAARNAIDCALWDLEAKQAGKAVWQLARLAPPAPLLTAYTISLAAPAAMAEAARRASGRPLLKIKLGGRGDEERIAAIRAACPDARLIADANESWPVERLEALLGACADAGMEIVEQPLPAGADEALAAIPRPVRVFADESVHERAGLKALAGRYDGVNIKLDKSGGLTEALALLDAAEAEGLGIMVGCMVGTSLSMAPAALLAQRADIVDLDGPLLLARDREHAIQYDGSLLNPPAPELWG
ncbi:MAG: dipeptide epimerase [Rhodobiaceae bacterium]|nr:dipeptide epimerase [Rhodobiaceae bacterium]